jgi:hypothetical protein
MQCRSEISRRRLWTGRILSALPALFLLIAALEQWPDEG